MTQQSPENKDINILQSNATRSLTQHHEEIRKRAETLLSKSNTDITRLTTHEIQKLIFEFQVHQIELELQNEELNRAYQDLSETRASYALLYNAGTVGYLTLNEEGVILHANRAAAQILACPQEMLAEKKLGEFIHPDDQDAYYFFVQGYTAQSSGNILTVRLKRRVEIPHSLRCPGFKLTGCSQQSCNQNQPFFHVEFRHAVYFNSNNDHHICLAISDISERKLAQESIACLNSKLEEKIVKQTQELVESNLNLQKKIEELHHSKRQLREREARLNAIFNAAIEGIITVDKSGIIVSVNSAIETIFGYGPEELIGCSINKLIPEGKGKKYDIPIKIQIPKAVNQISNVEGMHKDGSLVPLDISIAAFSVDGIDYYTSIVRDVSLRKLKEQEDKKHLDELAHVTRLGLMGEMASGIAHEVNQPLAAIAGYTQACLNFMQAEKPDLLQLREILQKTHLQALRAGDIIHRMRDFVTFKTIHRSSTEINDLVNGCVSLCASDLKHSNIVQRYLLAKNLPIVYVNSVQIEQVLLNLIRNSLDALNILSENTQRLLSIQTSLDDHHCIIIRVKDNGPGIEKIEQEKILTPFYTTKKSGMGMGLSISQSIVKAHGGVLSFNSTPGKGTTFYFTLPTRKK